MNLKNRHLWALTYFLVLFFLVDSYTNNGSNVGLIIANALALGMYTLVIHWLSRGYPLDAEDHLKVGVRYYVLHQTEVDKESQVLVLLTDSKEREPRYFRFNFNRGFHLTEERIPDVFVLTEFDRYRLLINKVSA